MNPSKESFLMNRIRSVRFSVRGIWLLLKTERSIKVQVFIAIIITIIGYFSDLSLLEWMIQFMAIGLVLVAEALNTAIEKISDFIQPLHDKKIESIKDIGAGAAGIAAIISLIVGGLIYLPRIQSLF